MGNRTARWSAPLASFALLVSCTSPRQQQASLPDCRVGLVMPTTGEMAPYGAEGVIAARLALQEARRAASHCAPVLLEQDSASQPDEANASAATLLRPPRPVQAIVGEINSADTASMVSQARLGGIPIIAPTASAISLTSMSDRVFRIWPSDAYEVRRMKEYVLSLGIRRVGVLFIKLPYGDEMASEFKREFSNSGGEAVLEGYPTTTLDFRPLLQRMRGFTDIYLISYVEDAALLLKQAYEMEAQTNRKFRFFGTSVLDTSKLIDKAGGAAEGLTFAVVQPVHGEDTGKRATFASEYRTARGAASSDAALRAAAKEPTFAGYHVYDAVSLAFFALDEVSRRSPPTGAALMQYFRTMVPYSGLTGEIKFDPKGDLASDRTVVLKRIEKGKIVPLQ
jgi:ABC-type branched-subunit amino acid transport system substrate-binding protein